MSHKPQPITTMQVGAGHNGAGYLTLSDATGAVGYCLAVDEALEAPNGDPWPDSGATTSNLEWWWFSKAALRRIAADRTSALAGNSSRIVPANSNPSSPTLQSDPLLVIPEQIGADDRAAWTCQQNPTFNPGGSPTSGSASLRLFQTSDGKLCLGFSFSGSGSGLALVNLFWATTETGSSAPTFWFGSGEGAAPGAIVVPTDLASVASYPSPAAHYQKKTMLLDPSTVPVG